MNVDLHFHTFPPFFIEELSRPNPWQKSVVRSNDGALTMKIGALEFPVTPDQYQARAILQTMDRMLIDVAAISPSPVMFQNHLETAVLVPLYRRVNDYLAELARAHPDRFRPLGLVCLQDPAAAIDELHRALDAGLAGVELETNIAGRNLDDPAFRPFFEAASDRGAVIFLHPLAVLGGARLRDHYLANLVGNPTDTSVAVASLIFGGVMEHCPGLRIVLPHGGGSTPCLCGRWDQGARVRPELSHMKTLPSEFVRRFWYDTLTHSEAALSLLLDVVGVSQLVLGSDHPYDMGDPDLVARIERRTDLDDLQKQAILGGNAARLLGLY